MYKVSLRELSKHLINKQKMTKQISILDSKEEQNATELYSVLPTVKKVIKHEPKIELLNIDKY